MKQTTLPLSKKSQRPVVILENFFHLNAMLDTGAVLPVWVKSEDLLKEIGGIPIAYNQSFGGFGGMTTGTLYKLPIFKCGELLYPELPIIASTINLPCQMILSAPMFDNLIYEIDNYSHKFNVTIPDKESLVRNLRVVDKNGTLHILCEGNKAGFP